MKTEQFRNRNLHHQKNIRRKNNLLTNLITLLTSLNLLILLTLLTLPTSPTSPNSLTSLTSITSPTSPTYLSNYLRIYLPNFSQRWTFSANMVLSVYPIGKHLVKNAPIWEEHFAFIFLRIWRKIIKTENVHIRLPQPVTSPHLVNRFLTTSTVLCFYLTLKKGKNRRTCQWKNKEFERKRIHKDVKMTFFIHIVIFHNLRSIFENYDSLMEIKIKLMWYWEIFVTSMFLQNPTLRYKIFLERCSNELPAKPEVKSEGYLWKTQKKILRENLTSSPGDFTCGTTYLHLSQAICLRRFTLYTTMKLKFYRLKFQCKSELSSAVSKTFISFRVDQRCFRVSGIYQLLSTLFQSRSALILSESALFRTEIFRADQCWIAISQRTPALNQFYIVLFVIVLETSFSALKSFDSSTKKSDNQNVITLSNHDEITYTGNKNYISRSKNWNFLSFSQIKVKKLKNV